MRNHALLFDLDGTLLDSFGLLLDSMEYAFAGRAVVPGRDAWSAGIGRPLRAQMREWHVAEHELDAVVGRYRVWQDKHLESGTTLYAGAREAVAWAKTAGVALGVVTSKGRGMTTRSLLHVNLHTVFDVIVTADDTTHHKPHPEPVHHALNALGIPPDRALFVGDSIHDMDAGRAAGTETGAALWGPFSRAVLAPAQPTHWLQTLADVAPVMEQLASTSVATRTPAGPA